jgi:hypothetical protein
MGGVGEVEWWKLEVHFRKGFLFPHAYVYRSVVTYQAESYSGDQQRYSVWQTPSETVHVPRTT